MKKLRIFKFMPVILGVILFVPLLFMAGVSFNDVGAQQVLQIDPNTCSIYISAAQRVSHDCGGLQIDWRALVAIDAVRLDQKFGTVTIDDAENLARKFVYREQREWDLKSLDEVLDDLGFSKDDKDQVKMLLDAARQVLVGPEYGDVVSGGGGAQVPNGEFINKVLSGAIESYKNYKVLPSITIAQGILESGWGSSGLTVKANNLFGIKAFSDWHGATIEMNTTEYDNAGNAYTVMAAFRAYNDWNGSIEDHSKILQQSNFRGVIQASNYIQAAQALHDGGYATDPQYPSLIIGLIEQYGLQKYDDPNFIATYTPNQAVPTGAGQSK